MFTRRIFLALATAGALSWQSPLALEYLLDVVPPALAAAVDGDPATTETVGGPK